MTVVDAALLAIAIGGALTQPRRVPVWAVPAVAAVVSVVIGSTDTAGLHDTLDLLAAPIAFLLAAVPLAALLDELGFFEAASTVAGDSLHLELWLWLLAGGVTVVLNLDAAVVLLTPLYIRVAATRGRDATALAFIPALQACVASSALPVSNLTNLLAAEHLHLSATQFCTQLGLPTIAATTAGYLAYRWMFRSTATITGPVVVAVDRRALRIGGTVVAAVLTGFALGGPLGIPLWAVVVAADAVLLIVLRSRPRLSSVPIGTSLLAVSLGVLAVAAARHVDVAAITRVDSGGTEMRLVAVGAAGAALMNNLPAAIVGLTSIGPNDTVAAWPLLLGVNMGALLLLTGSLSNLLWQRAAADAGVRIGARQFSRVGLRVGLTALTAATLVRVLVR